VAELTKPLLFRNDPGTASRT